MPAWLASLARLIGGWLAPTPSGGDPPAPGPPPVWPPVPTVPPGPLPRVVPAMPAPEQVKVTADLLAEHNRVRRARGLVALRADDRAICAATLGATLCAQNGALSHFSKYGSTPWSRLATFGIGGYASSENLAEGTTDAAETVRAWLADPAHAENVLGDYNVMGGAMVRSADGRLW